MKNLLKNNKALVLLLAAMLVIGGVVGGTVAWLMDSTEPVINTFTTSDVTITLKESPDLDLKMVPGCTITKDPVVTVEGGSEKCWLFVKADASVNFGTYMTYTMVTGWTAGDGTAIPANVYYREVESSTADQTFDVIENNTVTVKDTVTKNDMTAADSNPPTLTFTAYACQFAKGAGSFAAAEAWAELNPTP